MNTAASALATSGHCPSLAELSGHASLNDGQKVTYQIEKDRKTGRSSAVNLQAA